MVQKLGRTCDTKPAALGERDFAHAATEAKNNRARRPWQIWSDIATRRTRHRETRDGHTIDQGFYILYGLTEGDVT